MDRASLQAAQILCALGLGLTLGLFYDLYRVWLRKGRKKYSLAVGDSLWWLFALAWTFFWLIQINWAELRFPVIIMVLLGLSLYIFCFSPVFLPLFTKLCRGLGKVLLFIWQLLGQMLWLLFTPVVFVSGLVYRLLYGMFCWLGCCLGKLTGFCGRAKNKTKRGVKKQAQKAKAKHTAQRAVKAQKAEAKKAAEAVIEEQPEAKDKVGRKTKKAQKRQQKQLQKRQKKAAKAQHKKGDKVKK